MNYKTIILLFMTTAINAQKVLVHGINSPTGSVQAIHQYEDGNCHYTPVTDVTISADSGMEVKMTFAVGNQGIKNPVFMGSRNVADSTITLIATDDAGLGMSQLKLTYGTATIVTTAQPVKQQPAADGKMTIQQAFERMTDGKTTGPNNAWTDSPTYSDKVVSGNRLTLTVKGNGGDVAAIYEITEVNGMWEWKEYSQSDPQNHLYKMTSVIPNASAENLEVNFTTGSLTGAKMVVNFGQPAATAPAPVKDGDDGTNNATKRRVPAPAKSGGNR